MVIYIQSLAHRAMVQPMRRRRESRSRSIHAEHYKGDLTSIKNKSMTVYQNIGKSVPRVDARGKVTGETPYSGDLSMDGMLHMKLLFADRPHARIKWIKTSKAEAAPGVVAVYTAKDVPVNEYGLQWQDQPVLCGPNQSLTLSRNRHKPQKPG